MRPFNLGCLAEDVRGTRSKQPLPADVRSGQHAVDAPGHVYADGGKAPPAAIMTMATAWRKTWTHSSPAALHATAHWRSHSAPPSWPSSSCTRQRPSRPAAQDTRAAAAARMVESLQGCCGNLLLTALQASQASLCARVNARRGPQPAHGCQQAKLLVEGQLLRPRQRKPLQQLAGSVKKPILVFEHQAESRAAGLCWPTSPAAPRRQARASEGNQASAMR